MKAYGRESYDGWAWFEGGKTYSRQCSDRGHKNNVSQKRTDRAMKKRARRNWRKDQ